MLEAICLNPGVIQRDVAAASGINATTIGVDLSPLVENGFVALRRLSPRRGRGTAHQATAAGERTWREIVSEVRELDLRVEQELRALIG